MVNLIKKLAIALAILVGIAYGYHYLTGKSITTVPGDIIATLQQKGPATESQNPKYYTDPAKRMPND